jgi:hypothetical protein
MRPPTILRNRLAAVAFVLVLGASAVAQEYQILRADYGYGDRRVDVTQRLRELARSDTSFRMGNRTFGVDPAPGQIKTLRIFARGSGGESRTFEYREGSMVDGAMFSGWRGGDWGRDDADEGQYQILHARYGVAESNVDVTQRLKELARQDRTFKMGNSTFGVDPAPGRVKTLRIYTRGPNRARRMFEYREGSVVDGSMFTAWGRGDWGGGGWEGRWEDDDGQNYPDSSRRNVNVRLGREVAERDFGGGSGGRPAPDARCASGFVAVGFHVQTGEYFNQAWLDCARLRSDGTLGEEYRATARTGSTGGRAVHDAQCRPGSVLRGLRGRSGASIDEIIGACSSLRDIVEDYNNPRVEMTDPVTIPKPGGRPAEALCPSGSVLVGFRSRSGEWMDHLWILCSELQPAY